MIEDFTCKIRDFVSYVDLVGCCIISHNDGFHVETLGPPGSIVYTWNLDSGDVLCFGHFSGLGVFIPAQWESSVYDAMIASQAPIKLQRKDFHGVEGLCLVDQARWANITRNI